MNKPILQVRQLNFRYENTPVLENVSVEIAAKEFVGIFGPNGGGKTTFLKLVMGLLKPDSGEILLFDRIPKEMCHKIGYVPQAMHFDKAFPISVQEVVMMGCLSKLSWWGHYPSDVKKQALEALEKMGLSHKAKASFGTLSGGEAQRTLIARAIVDAPQLLILDEPTASVDPKAQQQIFDQLTVLNQSMTILMVTHDLQTIIDRASKLLCIHRHVTCLKAKEVCEHFALGLYHTPLTSTKHFSF